jgi:hypothetical protein
MMTLLKFNIKKGKIPWRIADRKKRYVGIGDPDDYILASSKRKRPKKRKKVVYQPKQNYRNELGRIIETSI